MRKILSVPYYSQKIDVSNPHWKERACGILCLKMVLDFLRVKTPPSDEFIQRGVTSGAYGEWGGMHEGLIKGFYYHDPDAHTPHEGKDQFVPIETFKKHWRRMAIFVDF